jgi:hypothetical protein
MGDYTTQTGNFTGVSAPSRRMWGTRPYFKRRLNREMKILSVGPIPKPWCG